jgi:hypothetical protein
MASALPPAVVRPPAAAAAEMHEPAVAITHSVVHKQQHFQCDHDGSNATPCLSSHAAGQVGAVY